MRSTTTISTLLLILAAACSGTVTVMNNDGGTGGGATGGGTTGGGTSGGGATGGGSTGGGGGGGGATGGGTTGGGATGGGATGGGATGGGATGGGTTGGGTTGGGGATGGGATGGGAAGGGGATGGGATGGGATGGGGGAMLNGGDTCSLAPDVTAGGTFLGTTDPPAVDDYGPSVGTCPAGGAGSGRDVAYALSPSVTTNYTITVTPLNGTFDPMLYVQATCGSNTCLAGTVLNGPGQPESVTVMIPGGTTAYVIVDGENVTRGPFSLTITP